MEPRRSDESRSSPRVPDSVDEALREPPQPRAQRTRPRQGWAGTAGVFTGPAHPAEPRPDGVAAEQVEVIIAVNAWQGFDLVAELGLCEEMGIELGILAPSPSQSTARSNPFTVVRVVVGGLWSWFKNHTAEECEAVAISRRTACEAKAKSCRVAGGQPFKAFRSQDYEEDRGVTFAQGIPPQYIKNDCNVYCWVGCSFGNGEYWTYNGQDGKTVHN